MSEYSIRLEELEGLADAIADLDGPGVPAYRRNLVEVGHRTIMRVLGEDVELVYGGSEFDDVNGKGPA